MTCNLKNILQEVTSDFEQVAAATDHQLHASADHTAQATEHITITIQDMRDGTDKQLRSIEQTSQVVNEMDHGINQQTVSSTAIETAHRAQEGNRGVQSAQKEVALVVQDVEQAGKEVSQSLHVVH